MPWKTFQICAATRVDGSGAAAERCALWLGWVIPV